MTSAISTRLVSFVSGASLRQLQWWTEKGISYPTNDIGINIINDVNAAHRGACLFTPIVEIEYMVSTIVAIIIAMHIKSADDIVADTLKVPVLYDS